MTESAKSAGILFFSNSDTPIFGDNEFPVEMRFQSDEDREVFMDFVPTVGKKQKLSTPFPWRADAPVSLSVIEFAPGYLLPLHSHEVGCLYYIERGTVVMGNRTIGPGDGFFVGSGQPYAYKVGPDGVKLLEFRADRTPDFTLRERNTEDWKQRWLRSVNAAEQTV